MPPCLQIRAVIDTEKDPLQRSGVAESAPTAPASGRLSATEPSPGPVAAVASTVDIPVGGRLSAADSAAPGGAGAVEDERSGSAGRSGSEARGSRSSFSMNSVDKPVTQDELRKSGVKLSVNDYDDI